MDAAPTSRDDPRARNAPARAGRSSDRLPGSACDILLVADRQAGTMYHFFRDWRFEAWAVGQATSAPLFVAPIDPRTMVDSGARYTMDFLAEQPAATAGGTASFAWAVATAGTSDPLADGLARAQGLLKHAGWRQDSLVATHFTKRAA